MTHRCVQAHLGKIRRESELSPACSGASQSPERGRICGHCPATAFHCNQSGAQGNDESPSEGFLPRLIVAGLSCAVPQHSALLSAHTHTYKQKQMHSVCSLWPRSCLEVTTELQVAKSILKISQLNLSQQSQLIHPSPLCAAWQLLRLWDGRDCMSVGVWRGRS